MSLHLVVLLHWSLFRHSPDLDRSWDFFITNTGEECLSVAVALNLGQLIGLVGVALDFSASVRVYLMVLSVASDGEHIVRLIRHSGEAREPNFLDEERFLFVTLLSFFTILVHVIEEDVVVDSCRGEAHIVFKPAKTADAVCVADVLHSVFARVEIVDVDFLSRLTGGACK
jgi:hypothetical protein